MSQYGNVLITGGGGYLGKKVIETLLEQKERPKQVVSMDVRSVAEQDRQRGVFYLEEDIRSPRVVDILRDYDIQKVVHLASIVTASKSSSREFEYSVDVEGTENLLAACIASQPDTSSSSSDKVDAGQQSFLDKLLSSAADGQTGVEQLVIASSGAAYGYHPDNPEWIVETDELRGNKEFSYSYHKLLVEKILEDYRQKFPELKQLIFRPGTILGAGVQNPISEMFERRFIIDVMGSDSRFVFVWDYDVARAIVQGLVEDREGIYNLAGSGTLDLKQIARIMGKPYVVLPTPVLKGIVWLMQKTGKARHGTELVKFWKYRPVLANDKLIQEFGYTPEMTTEEVFRYYLEHASA